MARGFLREYPGGVAGRGPRSSLGRKRRRDRRPLPDSDGLDLIRELRATCLGATVLVPALSENLLQHARSLRARANMALTKGASLGEISTPRGALAPKRRHKSGRNFLAQAGLRSHDGGTTFPVAFHRTESRTTIKKVVGHGLFGLRSASDQGPQRGTTAGGASEPLGRVPGEPREPSLKHTSVPQSGALAGARRARM